MRLPPSALAAPGKRSPPISRSFSVWYARNRLLYRSLVGARGTHMPAHGGTGIRGHGDTGNDAGGSPVPARVPTTQARSVSPPQRSRAPLCPSAHSLASACGERLCPPSIVCPCVTRLLAPLSAPERD